LPDYKPIGSSEWQLVFMLQLFGIGVTLLGGPDWSIECATAIQAAAAAYLAGRWYSRAPSSPAQNAEAGEQAAQEPLG
jgi:hypothetical protein